MGRNSRFDTTVVMYGVQPWYPEPRPFEPWQPEPTPPYEPQPLIPATNTTVRVVVEDVDKRNRLKRLAAEMLGAGEALVAAGRRRFGRMLIKYSRKLMMELEDE